MRTTAWCTATESFRSQHKVGIRMDRGQPNTSCSARSATVPSATGIYHLALPPSTTSTPDSPYPHLHWPRHIHTATCPHITSRHQHASQSSTTSSPCWKSTLRTTHLPGPPASTPHPPIPPCLNSCSRHPACTVPGPGAEHREHDADDGAPRGVLRAEPSTGAAGLRAGEVWPVRDRGGDDRPHVHQVRCPSATRSPWHTATPRLQLASQAGARLAALTQCSLFHCSMTRPHVPRYSAWGQSG